MDVTLRQLRALLAVAKTGSFTRAAESMHITQSAFSGLIRELESQLGVRLVDRSTRQAQLSDVGKTFHDMVAGLLRELDEALTNIDGLKRLRHGVVRIAAPQLMASTLMPEAISKFGAKHPEIEVRLADCGVDEVINAVATGAVDIGVGPQRAILPATLAADPFINPPMIAVFPRGHPLQKLVRVSWRELVRFPLIALQGQYADQLERDLFGSNEFAAIKPKHQVAYMSTALGMVSAGMGVSVCLPYAQSLVDLYRLESRPLVEPEVRRRFFIYARRHANLSPAAVAFKEALLAYANPPMRGAIQAAQGD